MQHDKRFTGRGLIAALGMFGANMAYAGAAGTITYVPAQAASVPTLSGWTLAVLGVLFAVIAFRVMRARNVGGRVASLVSAGIMALGGMGSGYLVDESRATAPAPIELNVGTGGQVTIPGIGTYVYHNSSGVSQRISVINILPAYGTKPIDPPDTECTVGLVLANGASCSLSIVDNRA